MFYIFKKLWVKNINYKINDYVAKKMDTLLIVYRKSVG